MVTIFEDGGAAGGGKGKWGVLDAQRTHVRAANALLVGWRGVEYDVEEEEDRGGNGFLLY